MIELSRHIESLMLKHDCVIVPGLGGFVTQYVPARHVNGENVFLPPYRSVGFNQQLTLNDGLLVQSYMQVYDTSYTETLKLINDAVQQLKSKLVHDGEYELVGIGRLTLDMGGIYNFIPNEAGVLSPELYGLDTVEVPMLANGDGTARPTERNTVSNKKINIKRTDKHYTLSINREIVNYVAAAVVALFFYFIWATPISDNVPDEKQTASFVYEQLFDKATQPKQQPQPIAKAEAVKNEPTAEAMAGNVETTPTTAQPTEQTTVTSENKEEKDEQNKKTGYTLVLASAITKENAASFSEKLKTNGMKEARPYQRGRMTRVVYGSYPTEQAAQQALARMRERKEFADAWVMQIK